MNLKIKQLNQKICNVLNDSDLPPEVKRLVMYQIYTEVKDIADETIYHELNDETHTAKLPLPTEEVKEDAEGV